MIQAQLQWRGERLERQLAPTGRLRIGRDPQRCELLVPAHWRPCSRLQAELRWDGSHWWIRDGGEGQPSANGTYGADGHRVQGEQLLGPIRAVTLLFGSVPDDRVQLRLSGLGDASSVSAADPSLQAASGSDRAAAPPPPEGPHPPPAPASPSAFGPPAWLGAGSGAAQPASRLPASLSGASTSAASTGAASSSSGPLAGLPAGVISIGRHPACSIPLDDPSVSRLHALIRPERNGAALLEDHSRNGLFVGGQRAARLSRLLPGADLRIGRSRFRWDGVRLQPFGEQLHYGIEVRDLTLPQRLRSLSLSIVGGQLVALVGGSGAGKSSLLTTLAGQNPGYGSRIVVNGDDLRHSIAALRPLMGFVPQDDIVHRDLTVEEVLSFAARLRIPDRDARQPAVERVLQLLEIDHRRSALVRELSGGQRKRVNIGMELVADPRLLFLNEPTSGLDPGLDRRMMRLLRQIADRGHTVLVVTHATANVNLCD